MISTPDTSHPHHHTPHDGPDRSRPRRSPWLVAAMVATGAMVGAALWGSPTGELAQLLVLLPAVYVVSALDDRPNRAWLALLVLMTVFFLAPFVAVAPGLAVGVVGLALTMVGLHRHGGPTSALRPQVWGAVVFVGLAVIALLLSGPAVGIVVALGWAGHAAWDAVHVWTGRVVSGSYAWWCGSLDLLVAVGLLVTTLG